VARLGVATLASLGAHGVVAIRTCDPSISSVSSRCHFYVAWLLTGDDKHHCGHLAVDPVTHDMVAAEVSLENVHDAEVLPTLLNPLRRKLGPVYADGAYDSKASHQLIGA
jgi:hypothetical protein